MIYECERGQVRSKHKVYKSSYLSKDSMLPGDHNRLPDESFFNTLVFIDEAYLIKNKKKSISLVMMSKKEKDNSLALFINSEFKDLISQNVNSSFTSKVSSEGLVMVRIKDNFIDFVFNNLSQDRVLFAGFIDFFFTPLFNNRAVNHFSSKISETELNLINFPFFNLSFISSTCSGLGGSSSTGCQSIASQNSQSSSVTSRVSLYLLDMSCFRSLTTALDNSSIPSGFSDFSSCILTNSNWKEDYLSFLVEEDFGVEELGVNDEFINILETDTISGLVDRESSLAVGSSQEVLGLGDTSDFAEQSAESDCGVDGCGVVGTGEVVGGGVEKETPEEPAVPEIPDLMFTTEVPDLMFTMEAASGCATWLGTTDTNWSIATNWDTGLVPNSTTCVILNNTASNQPTLDAQTGVYNLTINGTLTLSMPWGSSLNVTENVVMLNGSLLTHGDNSNAETYNVNMSVGGNFTLETGGVINVTGLG